MRVAWVMGGVGEHGQQQDYPHGDLHCSLLTLMPSHRDTARRGRSARSVLIDLNAGMSSAPAQIAAKFISETYKTKCVTGSGAVLPLSLSLSLSRP